MIEAEPFNFLKALDKKRNVTLVPACLSLSPKPSLAKILLNRGARAKIDPDSSGSSVSVQCLPLYSILLALNRTSIDLFTLDIEGNELDVLRTVPFDKVDIKVGCKKCKEGRSTRREFIENDFKCNFYYLNCMIFIYIHYYDLIVACLASASSLLLLSLTNNFE
jgi:hypothetical protein